MAGRLFELESHVLELEHWLRAIEARLDAIERHLSLDSRQPISSPTAGSTHVPHPELQSDRELTDHSHPGADAGADVVAIASFIGRTFVALGGAYLLRALTESHVLPQPAGIVLGLAYAIGWLVLADRAGAAARRTSAAFHAFVAAIIAFPLLWEAATRFRLLNPAGSALAVAVVTGIALAAAVRQRLQPVAWIGVIGALATILALTSATGSLAPFATVAILLGVTTLWLGYSLEWVFLRWPAALIADLMVFALALRVSRRSWPDPPAQIVALQLLLLTTYVTSIAVRTLIRGREVLPFEVVQTFAVLAIGFGGAVYVANATGSDATALAWINLTFGVGAYGVALVFVERLGQRGNFYFYTSLGLVLVLASLDLLLAGTALALTWASLAVVVSAIAYRTGRATLVLHAWAYLFAGATISGLLQAAADALIGPEGPWRPFSATSLVVVAAAVVCWLVPMQARGGRTASAGAESAPYARLARLPIAALTIWSVGGWMVTVLRMLVARSAAGAPEAGTVATLRTIVLAVAALAIAWAARHERFRESRWLLYPVLVAGGLKLFVEDMPRSEPATLFLALAFYGGALIIAPRLSRLASISEAARFGAER